MKTNPRRNCWWVFLVFGDRVFLLYESEHLVFRRVCLWSVQFRSENGFGEVPTVKLNLPGEKVT